jgi:hypothetical protein
MCSGSIDAIPAALAGLVEAGISIAADAKTSNMTTIKIQ